MEHLKKEIGEFEKQKNAELTRIKEVQAEEMKKLKYVIGRPQLDKG